MGQDSPFTVPVGELGELFLKQKIFAVVFILVLALLTIEFIRRRALMERYAILWLTAAFVLVPLVLWQDLTKRISQIVGIAYMPLTILLIAILFIVLILFHFSAALTKTRRNETELVMRIVEQGEEIRELQDRIDHLEGRAAGSGRPDVSGPAAPSL